MDQQENKTRTIPLLVHNINERTKIKMREREDTREENIIE
jgi:hypothetical protein